jgi:hypothetical protein
MSLFENMGLCKACGSINLDKFIAEMGVRRPGLKYIDISSVWVFSEVVVCLNCGRAEFVVPTNELRQLPQRNVFAA